MSTRGQYYVNLGVRRIARLYLAKTRFSRGSIFCIYFKYMHMRHKRNACTRLQANALLRVYEIDENIRNPT